MRFQETAQRRNKTRNNPKKDLPKGQMPDLGRPTDKDDALPLFDYETYFTGKWKFEWIVPESVVEKGNPGGYRRRQVRPRTLILEKKQR